MKPISLLLIPSIALFVSACAGPAGPGYAYGPGPNPRSGYYWNGSVYVEGEDPHHHDDGYNRDNRDVNVDRTNVNDRTVNNTTINNTSVSDRTVDRTDISKANVKKTNVKRKPVRKEVQQPPASQNGQ